MKTAFIGHRHIFDGALRDKIYKAAENEIKKGCKCFMIGTRGDFDKFALSVCRELRNIYKDIKIEVVITSLAQLKPSTLHDEIFGDEKIVPYEDVQTIMFEIEETHFKRKITESNKQMIDNCNTLICYVDTTYKYSSGAKTAYNYAKKKGLQIINLFA